MAGRTPGTQHKEALAGRVAERVTRRARKQLGSRAQPRCPARNAGWSPRLAAGPLSVPGRARAACCCRIGRRACQSVPACGLRPLFPWCLRAAGAEIQIPAAVGVEGRLLAGGLGRADSARAPAQRWTRSPR